MNISRSVESFASIASGLVSVPLIFDENGRESEGAIVSGIAGIKVVQSFSKLNQSKVPVVSSTHGWAIFR